MTVTSGPQLTETLTPVPPATIDPAEQGRTSGQLAIRQICPFLAIDGGGWRSSNPSRDHRCGAVTPAVPLAIDKQRRLCLADTHILCSTYLAAIGTSPSGDPELAASAAGRPGAAATPTVTRWSLVRTVPVVLDRGRVPPSVGAIARNRRGGQLVLAGLLVAAFAAVAMSRLSGDDPSNQVGAIDSSTPSPPAATLPPTAAQPTPVPTLAPTVAPSSPPSVAPSATPAPTPAPSYQTYTVQSGDTLTAIARRFGTTVEAIAELNNIARADYGRLAIGRVLLIP